MHSGESGILIIPPVLFIGLNPSTADENINDATVEKCISFAKKWKYGGVYLANLFAFQATKPSILRPTEDPIGPDNDAYISELSAKASIIVAAWGNHGTYLNRHCQIIRMLSELHYLMLKKSGQPAHPLYLKSDLIPRRWYPDRETRNP